MKDKVVFTNGCFDIVHRGHLELLKYCSTLGKVVVGLNSDQSVEKLKGSNRPFFSQEDRKFMLQSLKYVFSVISYFKTFLKGPGMMKNILSISSRIYRDMKIERF